MNQLNPVTITETLYESIECRLPTVDNKLPIKNKNTVNDNRQILEVSDTETIENFLATCSSETKLNLNILLPYVLLYIPDHTFLETVYNRFVNHLFMWESSVPVNKDLPNVNRPLMNSFDERPRVETQHQNFQTCRSLIYHLGTQLSDEDQVYSDDEDQGALTPKSKKKAPNSLVLQVNIKDIHLAANAHSSVRIKFDGYLYSKIDLFVFQTESSTTVGEFAIHGQGLTLALVDGYQGDPNLQYFCLLTHSALLQHNSKSFFVCFFFKLIIEFVCLKSSWNSEQNEFFVE